MGQIKFTVKKVHIDHEFDDYDDHGNANIYVQCHVNGDWGVKSKEVVADDDGDAEFNQDYVLKDVKHGYDARISQTCYIWDHDDTSDDDIIGKTNRSELAQTMDNWYTEFDMLGDGKGGKGSLHWK